MGNGYWGKLLRINLTDHSFTVEEVPEDTWKKFVGGSALGAALLLREVPPGVDPLAPENKLTFGVGCFQAGKVPGNAKWSVCTKSPLTGTWLDSAGAGSFAPRFKQCGYDHLVVEGRSPEPVHVHISADGVDFLPAADLMGLDIKESAAAVKKRRGKQAAATGPRVGQVPGPHDHILNQYYARRGWDREGRPTARALADLGLEEFASFLPGDAGGEGAGPG